MSWIAAAPAAFEMGRSLGSGDKKDDGGNTGTYAGDTAANMALDYYNQTQGVRKKLTHTLHDSLYGVLDQNPVYDAGRNTIEDQYGVAKENIMGSMPTGGQLNESIANLETDRADALTGLKGQTFQDMLNKAFTMATGAATTAPNTVGGLAGSEAMLTAQNRSQQYRALSDMGYALGQIASDK